MSFLLLVCDLKGDIGKRTKNLLGIDFEIVISI